MVAALMAVCIECGENKGQSLYRQFTGGTIQLSQCPSCKKVIDKYVEFDAVILLLDVLLLRVQSYRHLIFNYGLSCAILWKFSVVLVLCEAYTKLRRLDPLPSDPVLLQIHFHTLFIQSVIEFVWLLLSAYVVVCVLVPGSTRAPIQDICRTVIISSFGKLSAVAAMVWTGDFYLWLPTILVLPAQLQAFRALLTISTGRAAAIVATQTILLYCLSWLLTGYRDSVVLGLVSFQPGKQHTIAE